MWPGVSPWGCVPIRSILLSLTSQGTLFGLYEDPAYSLSWAVVLILFDAIQLCLFSSTWQDSVPGAEGKRMRTLDLTPQVV